jgi:hypothetical protein
MRWLFKCLYVVLEFKRPIIGAYAAFVVWTLARWIQTARATQLRMRDWLGAFGLAAGAFSASLLALYHIYFAAKGTPIADGSALDVYLAVGSLAGVAGVILGLIGRGWVRSSALIVSLAIIFHWYWMWAGGMGLDEIMTSVTLLLVCIGAIILARQKNVQSQNEPSS